MPGILFPDRRQSETRHSRRESLFRNERVLGADDDAALVERCLSGEEAGVRLLVERFQGMIFGLCYRMLGQREDAEDVAQDVFLRVFRSLGGWDSARPLKPWVLTIAANRCRTVLRKRTSRPVPTEFIDDLAVDDSKRDVGDFAEELQRALDKLREEYRICFVLFHQQEIGCAEIGEMMDRPEGTVKTWLHRARRQLAEELQRRGVGPEPHVELKCET